MSRLLLVRHGRAEAAWGSAEAGSGDPGLDDAGRQQAISRGEVLRDRLAELGPDPVVWCSPRRRAQETAALVAAALGARVEIDARLDEVPSPATGDRRAWLEAALRGQWADLGSDVARWRAGLVAWATEPRSAPAVVAVTHFVAINALVAAARSTDAVTSFLPDLASCTELSAAADGTLEVVALGGAASTEVG